MLRRQASGTLGEGKASVLIRGQRPGASSDAFTGARVALMDVLLTVATGARGGPQPLLRIGSAQDPVYMSSLASAGDDVTVNQAVAQARIVPASHAAPPRTRARAFV